MGVGVWVGTGVAVGNVSWGVGEAVGVGDPTKMRPGVRNDAGVEAGGWVGLAAGVFRDEVSTGVGVKVGVRVGVA